MDGPRTPHHEVDSGARPGRSRWRRAFPVLENTSGYRHDSLRHDLVAGVTVAAVAIPAGMAYSELVGVSPVVGLYTLLLPVVAYALLGSSRQVAVGAEAVLALMVGDAIAGRAGGDAVRAASLAAIMALLVGGCFLVARLLRLGWIADYFSRPVLVGYIHGTAVVLIVGQLPKMLGVSVEGDNTVEELVAVIQAVPDASATTALLAAVSLVALLLLKRTAPRVPGSLVVVVAGILLAVPASLESHGIALLGEVPSGLPALGLPEGSLDDVVALAPAAVGIFLVCFADGVLTARSFAGRHGQHVRAEQELVALSAANVAAGMSGTFPIGASGSRTTVNDNAGARTQLVGLVSAVVIALVLLFLTAPVAKIPLPCLGAVIVAAAIGLIARKDWRSIAASSRREVAIAAVTTVGVITLGVLWALLIAVALSILDTVSRAAKPHDAVLGWVDRLGRYADVSMHPSAQRAPGVVVYRLDDRWFYANSHYIQARILEALDSAEDSPSWLVFDAEGLPDIDATGAASLEQLVDQLRAQHVSVVVARLKSPVAQTFESTGLTRLIGPENFQPTVERAVAVCLERSVPAQGEAS